MRIDPGTLQLDSCAGREACSSQYASLDCYYCGVLLLGLLRLQNSLQRVERRPISQCGKCNLLLLPHRSNPSCHLRIVDRLFPAQDCGNAASPTLRSIRRISGALPKRPRRASYRPPCPHLLPRASDEFTRVDAGHVGGISRHLREPQRPETRRRVAQISMDLGLARAALPQPKLRHA